MTLAHEWAYAGVRVNAVSPGWIASSGMDTYQGEFKEQIPKLKGYCPLGRLGTESEVSAAVCFLLSDAAGYITGTELRIDGGVPLGNRSMELQATRTDPRVQRLPPRGEAQGAGRLKAMPIIESQVDRNGDDYKQQPREDARRHRRVPRRRGERAGDVGEVARPLRQAQAAHAARAHRPAARPRRAVPRIDAARGLPHARRQGRIERRRRLGRGHRLCRGRALRGDGLQLRHQGRHRGAVRPAQGPAHPAGRDGEQAAGREPGRIGRRQPSVPGRDLRAGRPRLRQPGAHVGARHPAGHRRARLVDRGRRLSARPLRLRHHGAQPGQGVPGRPAAAEGRDRRDRHRRGAGRRRDARHRLGRRRMDGRERCRRAAHGARGHRQVALERQAAAAAGQSRSRSRSTTSTSSAVSCRPRTRIPTTCAR